MNHKITNSDSLAPEIIRAKIKEADLYVSHGLFDQAREIYQSLLRHFQSQIESPSPPGEQSNKIARAGVKVLQERLREIDRRFDPFYERPKVSEPPQGAGAELDKEAIFNTAAVLKEIGLYDEAIQEFQRAAKLRHKVSESYEKIADSFIQKGDFLQGIKVLRIVLQRKDISPTQRTTILEKLASAYEATGEKKKALETYQELVNEVTAHTSAFEKVQQLTREVKRFRLSIALVTEHPRFFLILSLVVAAFFIAFVPFTKTEDNVDYLILEDDPDVKFYENFKDIFGNDEFFVIAFEQDDVFTEKNLTILRDLTAELEELDMAEEVTSLANVDDTVGSTDYFEVRQFIEDIPRNREDLKKLKKQALGNPLYVKNLISADGRTASIMVRPYDRPEEKDYAKRLLEKTREILDRYRSQVDEFHLAGRTTTSQSLSRYMKKDVGTFIPVTYLLITIAIWFLFRNLRLTVLAVINISLCVGSTMGLLGLTGIALNNVTSIIPPLVMALALCDTVHIFSHMDKKVLVKFPDKRKALASVLKKVVLPSFLTTLTTAIGFLSLAVSEIRPIREFAFIASVGMVFEFIYSFFLLPPLIMLVHPEKVFIEYEIRTAMSGVLRFITKVVHGYSRAIVAVSCVVIIGACWYTSQVQVETNLIDFFKPTTDFRKSLGFVEKRLGGVETMDISLMADQIDAFQDPSNLQIIENVQQYVKSVKGVDATVSFADFMKDMNESFHDEDPRYYTLPETREMVSQYLLLYDSDEIEDFINSTYDHARISVRISEHGSDGQKRIIREIQDYVNETEHPGIQIRLTGTAVQQVDTIDALVEGQVYSLILAAGVIAVIMFFVLRSIALGALSILPNLFPIILNFGIMGIMGIPLDTGTALIAAVALGIAVDDTIHFLIEYKTHRAHKSSISKSLEIVTHVKGRAMISSSLILCIGFGVLVLSSFVPTIHFGMLNAIIMVTAVTGDLVLLPSILLLRQSNLKEGVTNT